MNSSLKDILRDLTKKPTIYSKEGTVLSVDGILCDVEPIDGSADILDVKITPSSNTGIIYTPKVGSVVQVSFVSDFEAYISNFSEIDKIEINCEEIVFNGGDNDGLILIRALVEKLNNLENKVNDIINAYNLHTHPYVNVSTPATTSVTSGLVAGTLTPTTQNEIEDTKITH